MGKSSKAQWLKPPVWDSDSLKLNSASGTAQCCYWEESGDSCHCTGEN